MTIRNHRVAAAAIAAAFVLSACAAMQQTAAPARGPSPRAECAPASATLYFDPDSAAILGISTPILQEIAGKIAACRTAGGELVRVAITAYPDAEGNRRQQDSQLRARARSVTEALVQAGVPGDKITTTRARPADAQLMQRRAEIAVEMW